MHEVHLHYAHWGKKLPGLLVLRDVCATRYVCFGYVARSVQDNGSRQDCFIRLLVSVKACAKDELIVANS